MALKLAQDDHKGNEQDLRKDKRSLKVPGYPFWILLILVQKIVEEFGADVTSIWLFLIVKNRIKQKALVHM